MRQLRLARTAVADIDSHIRYAENSSEKPQSG
jgi:hypothetical protein